MVACSFSEKNDASPPSGKVVSEQVEQQSVKHSFSHYSSFWTAVHEMAYGKANLYFPQMFCLGISRVHRLNNSELAPALTKETQIV